MNNIQTPPNTHLFMDKNSMKKARILIVEDEAIIGRDLQMRLQSMGYDVPNAEPTGEGAIKRVLEIKPDLILMDIVLIDSMDGIETARRILSKTNVPIIYLTAYPSDNIFEKARQTDPFGYLIKPIPDAELKSTIELAIARHRTEKNLIRARREWETIFNSIGQPVVVLDTDQNIIEANKSVTRALRMTRKELQGEKCYKIFHGSSKPPHNCPMSNVFESREAKTEIMEVEAFGGTHLVSCTPLFDEEGNVDKVIQIITGGPDPQ